MNERSRHSWEAEAERYLTEAELDVERGAKFSVAALAHYCGVNRTTLWRHSTLRGRVEALLRGKEAAREKASILKRSKSQEKVLRLQLRLENLTRQHNRLILGYLEAYARLNELGIDPRTVFGDQFFHGESSTEK